MDFFVGLVTLSFTSIIVGFSKCATGTWKTEAGECQVQVSLGYIANSRKDSAPK